MDADSSVSKVPDKWPGSTPGRAAGSTREPHGAVGGLRSPIPASSPQRNQDAGFLSRFIDDACAGRPMGYRRDELQEAVRRLEEQFEVEREAFRLACRDLQDAHAGFTDIRKHDYEPPDDDDVETLMGWLRGRAKFNGSNPASEPKP